MTQEKAASAAGQSLAGMTRRERITAILAEHPEGLPTPRIVELSGECIQPRQRALTRYGQVLRKMARDSGVARAGHVPAAYNNVPTLVWRITGAALREPRGQEADDMRSPSGCEKPIDPLIIALIAKLPPEGTPFPLAARERWLELMRLALDLIYGVCDEPVRTPLAVAG